MFVTFHANVSEVPLFHIAAGGLIALGIGMAVYENREELAEAFEDFKVGVQAAIENKRRRKVAANAPGGQQNYYTNQGYNDQDDDDLYHTANTSGHENTERRRSRQEEESNTESDSELWDSTRTLTTKDGQTSGVYDRKATFRGRSRGASRRAPNAPPTYALSSSDDGPSTALSSTSSGEETPEDEQSFNYEKLLPKKRNMYI